LIDSVAVELPRDVERGDIGQDASQVLAAFGDGDDVIEEEGQCGRKLRVES